MVLALLLSLSEMSSLLLVTFLGSLKSSLAMVATAAGEFFFLMIKATSEELLVTSWQLLKRF